MSPIVSCCGVHMEALESIPTCGHEEEDSFLGWETDINSVLKDFHNCQEYIKEIPILYSTTESVGELEKEGLPLPAVYEPYDPLNNLLWKYKKNPTQFFVMCSLYQMHQEEDSQMGPNLLPNRDINDNRKTLVLDMDETLIHCGFKQDESEPCDWIFTMESKKSFTPVFCWVRPHLQIFLREASKIYEIVVFTASTESYANKVLDLIDPNGYIEHRLFRQHCTKVHGKYVKNLTLLGRSLDQTLIIDNSPISFAFQPTNGILCDDWRGNRNDCELLQLLPILQLVHSTCDVREELWDICYIGQFLIDLCEAQEEN